MNQYSTLKSRPVASLRYGTLGWREALGRRIVALLVGFHPSLTEKDQIKAIPSILKMLLISLGSTLLFIAYTLYHLLT
ncbi:hypothetical protein ACFSUS_09400 [Spirosoma soli]|uniref:Uncharacterized protein n=1 Tax=Spirosoma soli TaxID=1770529 RepID=A0ABW5M3Z8_9BACT